MMNKSLSFWAFHFNNRFRLLFLDLFLLTLVAFTLAFVFFLSCFTFFARENL